MTDTTHKVFTLLSGGVDSSTTLAIARLDFPNSQIECVTVDYGQRHHKEMECAQQIAAHFGADHIILNLNGLLSGMLVDKGQNNEEIPNVSYADLPVGISPTYVSFRNGTMLSLLAARAQSWVMALEVSNAQGVDVIGGVPVSQEEVYGPITAEATLYCGVHADDGVNWAYPDCTPEFIGAMQNAIYIGTYNKVRLRAPLQYMNKTEVVRTGYYRDVPFDRTWSCYKGGDLHCGACPTCRSRQYAFGAAGIPDHDVQYATEEPTEPEPLAA